MTPVYDEIRRRSIYKNVQLFISSITDIPNVAVFKHFLCTFGETVNDTGISNDFLGFILLKKS